MMNFVNVPSIIVMNANVIFVGDSGVSGPTSSHVTTVMTEDTGKFVGTGDTGY